LWGNLTFTIQFKRTMSKLNRVAKTRNSNKSKNYDIDQKVMDEHDVLIRATDFMQKKILDIFIKNEDVSKWKSDIEESGMRDLENAISQLKKYTETTNDTGIEKNIKIRSVIQVIVSISSLYANAVMLKSLQDQRKSSQNIN
jgi:hypothetical protein